MPETITVDIWSICVFGVGVLAIAAIVIGYAVVRRVIKRTEIRKAEGRAERQRQHEERQEQFQQDRDQLAELFPQPWLQTYNACEGIGRSGIRLLWLKTWLQDGSGLPGKQLSMEGIKKFAEMVGESDFGGDNFREAWELLRPYYKSTSVTPVGTPMPRITADLCKICKQRGGIVRERSDGITCGVHCDQCWRYCYQGWDADEL